MTHTLESLDTVISSIRSGKRLLLAGDEAVLKALPRGNWIAGTIPYFMSREGALLDRQRIFVSELPEAVAEVMIRSYAADQLENIPADAPENGVSVIILPASSKAHLTFAERAPHFPGIHLKPLIGWVAGVAVEDIGKVAPKVFDGLTGAASTDRAVVLHASLPAGKAARIDIVNIFTQGDGEAIEFDATGLTVRDCRVGGKRVNFAQFLKTAKIDTQLPLVADYHGAMINTSFQSVGEQEVQLYAPVFPGVVYKVARKVDDYEAEFARHLPAGVSPAFSCNCILNYLYGKLEGKRTGAMVGPITFGEIAYQLLNQTLVYLEIVGQ